MKVDFYMGPEFLRTAQKTNPYFDPIIRVCEANGIEWRVLFPGKPKECGYPKERIGSFGGHNTAATWFYRIVHLFWRVPDWRINYHFGRLARFFGLLKTDIAITIGGWLAPQLAGANPSARIVDVQHGVIFSGHRGYFSPDGKLVEQYQLFKRREFWLYGEGYAQCFYKNPENEKWLGKLGDKDCRVKIIGDVIRSDDAGGLEERMENDNGKRSVVAFSLQFTHDCSREENESALKRLEEFTGEFLARHGADYVLVIKHHPRFCNCIDMSAYHAKFPQVKEDRTPWKDLYPRLALHVTFCSTVAFDCASAGVPTYLVDLPNAKILHNGFFKNDYGYPFYGKTVDEILAAGDPARQTVQKWYRRFYASFDSEQCLKLLKGE